MSAANVIQSQTLALAGVFQAAHLIKQLGLVGKADEQAFLGSVQSVLQIDAPDIPTLFGQLSGVSLGLYSLKRSIEKSPDLMTLRYVFSLLTLGKRVLTDPALAQQLQRRLMPVISQATHFGLTEVLIIRQLSLIYQQVFLARNLRVVVQGQRKFINQVHIPDQIRAIVLAGIRSSVLWFQVGGNRWQLLLKRSSIQSQVNILLHVIFTNSPE